MASPIFQRVGKQYGRKALRQQLEHYAPEDPVYDYFTDANGKRKRRKRSPPPGLSKHDIRVLQTIQSRAHILDRSLSIFRMRFGYTAVLGFLPLLGPSIDFFLSYLLIIRKVRQLECEVPPKVVRNMLMNALIGTGVGFLIPVLGDVFMAIYKQNSRNALLLEKTLRKRSGKDRIRRGLETVVDDGNRKPKKRMWWKCFRRQNNSIEG